MKKHIGIVILFFVAIRAYSQCPSTVYVRDLGKYGRVESCQKEKGEAINMVISLFNEQTYNYGKWRFYYSDGRPRAEGFITLEVALNTGFRDLGYTPKPYIEKRTGKWVFWDEQGNQTVEFYH